HNGVRLNTHTTTVRYTTAKTTPSTVAIGSMKTPAARVRKSIGVDGAITTHKVTENNRFMLPPPRLGTDSGCYRRGWRRAGHHRLVHCPVGAPLEGCRNRRSHRVGSRPPVH